jgi:metal-responsive CopG/Arc/MetJ family transcriptional regulator
MAMVRATITLPAELLSAVDETAGTRGRSQYIAEAVERRLKRERIQRMLDETAGAIKGSKTWPDAESVERWVRELRENDRDRPR